MKLSIITVSNPIISDVIKAYRDITKSYGKIFELDVFYVGRQRKNQLDKINSSIKSSQFLILDLMGSMEEIQDGVLEACRRYTGNIVPIGGENSEIRKLLKLGSFSAGDMKMGKPQGKKMDMESMQKMINMTEKLGAFLPFGKIKDMKNYIYITKYWMNAGTYEIKNLLYLILREYGNYKMLPKPSEPMIISEVSICTPKDMKYFKDIKEYSSVYKLKENKPLVAVLFYGHNYPNKTCHCVEKIIERVEEFANVLPIACRGSSKKNLEEIERLLNSLENIKPDVVMNFMSFRLGAGPMGGNPQGGIDILENLEAQYIHPFFMSKKEVTEWKNSKKGLNPSEFLITVMLPELDGAIETIPVGAIEIDEIDEEFNVEISELKIIDERVDRLVEKIKNWINLRRKPNSDKKLAIICYNYPPGEGNIFGGGFLDTFTSVEKVLSILKNNHYTIENSSKEYLMENFTVNKIVNSPRWENENHEYMIKYPIEKYNDQKEDKKIIEDWGKAPGDIMSYNGNFLIPGITSGNVFIGLQPSRGVHENPEKAYHDKELNPHHQYIAFYKYIREEFKADVIVHVGTHGTLEFLNGKECGMSGECYPDKLIGDIPHLYLYYCGNPSEAVIAKRRSHAVTIGYQSPPFTKSELYGELSELEKIISEYKEAELLRPNSLEKIKIQFLEKAAQLNMDKLSMDEIENELYRIKNSLMPKGLHVFAQSYSRAEALEYMKSIVKYDRAEGKSIKRILAEVKGYDYDKLLKDNDIEILSELEYDISKLVEDYINFKKIDVKCDETALNEIKVSLEFGKKAFENSMKNYEKEGLLRGLNGKYLNAKIAGDMIRNPQVFPTGYNLYQFDPRMVPTVSACMQGKNIAENTLQCYKEKSGIYPKSTAVVLWGLETSRTQGETIGQILAYLGVRVKSNKNIFMPEYEIIPIEELGRPRIDVVINICGFFRDMFPNLIYDLNKIFKTLWKLEESDEENYFKANSTKIYKELISQGYSKKDAEELCYSRIFGPAEGAYGTNVTKLIETSNWKDENQIGQAYLSSLKYVYNNSYSGKEVEGLLEKSLSAVDIVSQIRSSHEYEVTDLDHYYEFFGGLSKSIEITKGKKAEIYISDTTGEKVETDSIDKSIEIGVRTRLLNPKWIDGMLQHKYHGVQKISERFENILGLAATTNQVNNWIFSSMQEVYIKNSEIKKTLIENNKWAYLSIVETLMECSERGYYNATKEELEELKKTYLEIEGNIEEEI